MTQREVYLVTNGKSHREHGNAQQWQQRSRRPRSTPKDYHGHRQNARWGMNMPKSLSAHTLITATTGASRYIGKDAAKPELRTAEVWQVFNQYLQEVVEGKARPP